jgi:predicted transcriptional regulator of viral defense system
MCRTRDLEAAGLSRTQIKRLADSGRIERLGRGLYGPAGAGENAPPEQALAEACARAPRAVVCLASALDFHHIGTQSPPDVCLMIDRAARAPRMDWPPVRVFRASGPSRTEGIETHRLANGAVVRVTGVARTVADCFKYRHKIGMDIALEALRESLGGRRATPDELDRFARICRVGPVMRPYLEAMVEALAAAR